MSDRSSPTAGAVGTGLAISTVLLAILVAAAALAPFLISSGPGPSELVSIRGETVTLHGFGPYRHMPAEVAVQGLAQDVVTLVLAVPLLLFALALARRDSPSGAVALTGLVGYVFVQYTLYLAMGTYNELFLLWVSIVLVSSQVLARLLLRKRTRTVVVSSRSGRAYIGWFLVVNGILIAALWLSVVVPPLLAGTLYPPGLAHLTTMVVQGFDLALFLPPSIMAGVYYLRRQDAGELLAPAYAVFLTLQMTALLAKITWMATIGNNAGPALLIIPVMLAGALLAAYLALRGGWRKP